MHQGHITQQTETILAPDPLRKTVRNFFTFFGILLGIIVAIGIALSFLPDPLRDKILFQALPTPLLFMHMAIGFVMFPLGLLPSGPTITSKQWKKLAQDRQQAAKDHFSGDNIWKTYPLPKSSDPLPMSVSVHLRRSWRATWIAGAIYSLALDFISLTFILDWLIGIQHLAQQEGISGWTFLYTLFWLLLICTISLPILALFLLAPHQKLIATRSGLFCYHYLHLSYIPWEDARLFAVIHKAGDKQVYELSSSTQVIRWSSKPAFQSKDAFPAGTTGVAPLGLIQAEKSSEEYQWQILQLILMVADGTGLPLYDLRQ